MTEMAWLLSRSCTTGWGDWIHGELWLLPRTILRRRLGLVPTLLNTHRVLTGSTVAHPLPGVPVAELDVRRAGEAHRTNKVIQFDDIARVRMINGLSTGGVEITTWRGERHKLLWLPREPAGAVLGATLRSWTGPAARP